MKPKRSACTIAIIGAIVFVLAGAYGITYHTGAQAKIAEGVVAVYDKMETGVVNGYQAATAGSQQ